MHRQGAFLSALLLLGVLPAFPQAKEQAKEPANNPPSAAEPAAPRPIVIPPEAAKKVNPIKPTAKSIEAGKQRYGYDCAMCHGENGDGKGDLALSMNLKLPDFRDPETLKSMTDGGLYYVIAKGSNPMPDEETRAKPEDIWNLVNYVRSLAEKKATAKSK